MISIKNKTIIIICIFIFSVIYTYPNIQGEDPAIIINKKLDNVNNDLVNYIHKNFEEHNIKAKSLTLKSKNNLIIRFASTEEQFTAHEFLKNITDETLDISLNILNSSSSYLFEKINAYPMKLGLDLRGGVHLLIKVNTKTNINKLVKARTVSLKSELREKNIKYHIIKANNKKIITLDFKTKDQTQNAYIFLKNYTTDFDIIEYNDKKIKLKLNKKYANEIKKNIIEQTTYILSKRVNELGISDSMIQPQGKNKIIVEIPGIQDISRAKTIIGKTATLNFMLIDSENSIIRALKGKIPKQSRLFYKNDKTPVLIKEKSILSGDAIIHASAGFEQQLNKPCINIRLGKKNIDLFEQTTLKNIGNQMAIVYKENIINAKKQEEIKETVISVATIMSALSNNFQITGLGMQESKDLALLLRSGALPATISIIEEKIIGPTLGEKNIKNGMLSVSLAFMIILLFMFLNYKRLGLIANVGLITNLILLTALMSLIDVTLTLPGLAGIVLTIGMSIDANILIFERIKEETKKEINQIYGIEKGFKNAFSSIMDSNLTTLIIGLVLFALGNGPIRGFAITLSIGIITSMYSSIFVTKTLTEILITKNIKLIKNENRLHKTK